MVDRRVIVTGVSGFIGGSLASYFAQCGSEVTGLSIQEVPKAPFPVRLVSYDVEEVSSAVDELRPTFLIHAAGAASVNESFLNPTNDFASSTILFQKVLEGVRRSGQRPRVVFLSSAAVYGNPKTLPIKEAADLKPISPYGYHKAICEILAREYSECFSIPTLIIRLFSLFGPAQRRLLLWEIFEQFRYKPEVVIQGTGDESRDYIHIDDMADSLILLLPRIEEDQMIINIASGKAVTVKEAVASISRILGNEKPVIFRGITRRGDPNFWQADVSLFERLIGRAVVANFDERLARTIRKWLA